MTIADRQALIGRRGLAASLVRQAAVPVMIRPHTTRPIATFAVLLIAVIAVDALRGAARLRRPALLGIAAVASGAAGALGSSGLSSPDILDDLNPPTLPLVLIGVGQTALDALMRARSAQAFVGIAGTRLMTVSLWHLLLVIGVAAMVLVARGRPLPVTSASAPRTRTRTRTRTR